MLRRVTLLAPRSPRAAVAPQWLHRPTLSLSRHVMRKPPSPPATRSYFAGTTANGTPVVIVALIGANVGMWFLWQQVGLTLDIASTFDVDGKLLEGPAVGIAVALVGKRQRWHHWRPLHSLDHTVLLTTQCLADVPTASSCCALKFLTLAHHVRC